MTEKKAARPGGIWKPFFSLLLKSKLPWFWVILTFALALGASYLLLLFPDYTEQVLGGDMSSGTVTVFVLIMLGSGAVNVLSYALQGVAGAKITRQMRKSIWRKSTGLPMDVIDANGSKELISRNTTDTESVGSIFAGTLPSMIASLYYVISSLILIREYDESLGIMILGLVVVQLVMAYVGGRIVFGLNDRVQTKLAVMTEKISEVMSNIPVVKIFTAEKWEERRGRFVINDFNVSSFKAQTATNALYYLSSLLNLAGYLILIIVGGAMVNDGRLDISEWIAFFMYYYYLAMDVQMIPYDWRSLKSLQGTVRRISVISTTADEDLDTGTKIAPSKSDISVENVTFGYGEKEILKNVSFDIPFGKTVALVGANGAGKSTVLALLERFYRPDGGRICYGGQDAEETSLSSWRSLFGYVQQDVRLMSGTVRDNLTYGVERQVSDGELHELCKKVMLDDFICSLPGQFDAPVEEFGENVSGGQRQKIAIVRAILHESECLLLDEYVSNLDAESSDRIYEWISNLAGERTVLVIAHSAAIIRHADRIVVLADGSVDAQGTHEELAAGSRVYAELLNTRT